MPYQNTQLSTLLTLLAARYEGQPWWTADQARRAINEGLRVWSIITGTWQVPFSKTTIPNDPYQYIDGTLVKGTRVTINGQRLIQGSLYGFDHGLHNWEGTTTATPGAPSNPVYWAPFGLTTIVIYPADATVLGSPMVVDGVRVAPILVNPTDYLDLGDEEINTLLGYALHVLAFYKGAAALQRTHPLYIAFIHAAAKRNAVFSASNLYRKMVSTDATRFYRPMEVTSPAAAGALAAVGAGPTGAQ